jgi:hypothetical protein
MAPKAAHKTIYPIVRMKSKQKYLGCVVSIRDEVVVTVCGNCLGRVMCEPQERTRTSREPTPKRAFPPLTNPRAFSALQFRNLNTFSERVTLPPVYFIYTPLHHPSLPFITRYCRTPQVQTSENHVIPPPPFNHKRRAKPHHHYCWRTNEKLL